MMLHALSSLYAASEEMERSAVRCVVIKYRNFNFTPVPLPQAGLPLAQISSLSAISTSDHFELLEFLECVSSILTGSLSLYKNCLEMTFCVLFSSFCDQEQKYWEGGRGKVR